MNNPNKQNSQVNIVYAANDGYSVLAGVSIISLFENNSEVRNIDVYILSDGISDSNQTKLLQIAKKYDRTISIIDISKELENIMGTGASSYVNSLDNGHTIYSRFIIGKIFPTLSRILYLDCDTLVNSNILTLYNRDLKENPIGLAYDCNHDNYKQYINLPQNNHYFNSGVMLTDLNKWRERNCYERIIDHITNIRSSYPLPDQDLLNIVLGNECTPLNMCDNYLSQYFLYNYHDNIFVYNKKPGIYWKEQEWLASDKALKEAIIIHFCGNTFIRPWYKNSKHPMKETYNRYYSISPWNNIVQEKRKMSIEYRIQYISYRFFPRFLNAYIGHIMQRAFMKLRYGV